MSLRAQAAGLLKPAGRRAQSLLYQGAASLGLGGAHPPVGFVIERADWAIRWYGTFIAEVANKIAPDTAWVTTNPAAVTRGIVSFGSQYQWLDWAPHVPAACRTVSTFFHGKPEDGPAVARHIDRFLAALPKLDRVVCSASLVRDRLLHWGAPPEKLTVIPIGCETDRFLPATPAEKLEARRRFGVPDGAIVVGSFQKDGEGWGEGMVPKLIKGPDAFVEAVRRLAKDLPIFALITGPARGYVKQGLEANGIPYAHHYAVDREDLARCYRALDLYLISSREEGGPMALMESMSSHVPVVSTRVGMSPDLIEDGVSGALVEVDDIDALVARARDLLAAPDGGMALKHAARAAVGVADWRVVGRRYLEEVWRPLLDPADSR
jgi:glycosyltransferase involved in cell wall biosynthesis